jgi:hypothetical protein
MESYLVTNRINIKDPGGDLLFDCQYNSKFCNEKCALSFALVSCCEGKRVEEEG